MGNQSLDSQIDSQITHLKVLQKHSHHSILQAPDQTEYIKFLYTPLLDQSDLNSSKSKKISIFDQTYLEYRWQQQQNHDRMNGLPKIWAFGEDTQNQSIISCTRNKLNYVIFQHPTISLKQQIEKRISSNQPFKQSQLITLIKSVLNTLSELYHHTTNWNSQISHKNTFLLSEDNIYVSVKGQFIVSDIVGHFNDLQNVSKHQVTLKRQSRTNSLTNLHAKITNKKVKLNYFQSNLHSIASIIEGIIFKSSYYNQTCKTTQQSSSLSTALSTYRSSSKGSLSLSLEFQQLLKDLKQQSHNYEIIIEKAEKLLDAIHLPTPIERSSQICDKNQITQEIIPNQLSNKTNTNPETFHLLNRIPLQQFKDSTENNSLQLKFDYILQQKLKNHQFQSNQPVDTRFMKNKTNDSNYFANIQPHETKQAQRKNTKIRLSLKKNDHCHSSNQKKLTLSQEKPNLKKSNSISKSLLNHFHQLKGLKGKQNILSLQTTQEQKQKIKNKATRSSCQKIVEKIMKVKVQNPSKSQDTINTVKQKFFLRKENNQKQNIIMKKCQEPEMTVHLNPMSRKKTFKMANKLESKNVLDKAEKMQIYKTNLKVDDIGMDGIENLSSIVSNQNNTISSYGIPTTEQFKTQDSMIEVEGCIQFNDNDDLYGIIDEKLSTEFHQCSQLNKKQPGKSSSSCVKLSSYQSFIFEGDQSSQEKIPQFLKQFKLPQKNLMTLNNIILKQKNVIVEQSFEQSELNSIRHSYPNVLSFEYC